MSESNVIRVNPPKAGDEREMLSSFLDYQRMTILQKVEGVDEAAARQPSVASSVLTLGGLVKHLAYVERWWFQIVFAGQDVSVPWSETDRDADFRVEDGESLTEIVLLYQNEVERSRQIVDHTPDLGTLAAKTDKGHTLRWVILHMLEETARHAGHADFLREAIDGVTGE